MNLDSNYFQTCTVTDLKKFLGARNVTVGRRNKADLVKLAADAVVLGLQVRCTALDTDAIEKRPGLGPHSIITPRRPCSAGIHYILVTTDLLRLLICQCHVSRYLIKLLYVLVYS